MELTYILEKVINSTETIFSCIAENYPLLLNELEKGVKAAELTIKNSSTVDDSDTAGEIDLNLFLEKCRINSREKLLQLDVFKERNESFIKKLSSAMSGYRSSQKYIEEIRDISESLQIVSLNALCNAVKAGKGGEGFSVITGNLKVVTETTIEKTGMLEKRGSDVSSYLDNFFLVEKETAANRKALLAMLEQKVIKSIDTFQNESETIDKLFHDLNDESDSIKKCILRIMEELQQQDLIRQTIDQVSLSINALPDKCEECVSDTEMDQPGIDKAVFCLRLLNLAVVMIEEVEGKIGKTIDVFTENFGTARRKLEYIQTEKNKAVQSFIENLQSLNELSGMRTDIQEEAAKLSSARKELMELISTLIVHVGGIMEEFSAFDKISGWLQNVSVLSRIELSRSNRLQGMKESVDDMSVLVERIQQQIMLGEKETASFIANSNSIFDGYKTFAAEEMSFLTEFTERIIENISRITAINAGISKEFSEFDFFTPEFCSIFDDSEKDLDQLKDISEDLKRVRSELKSREEIIRPALTAKLQDENILDWTIADDEMNRIIEKFTIFSHKRTAGEVSGLDVEDAALEEGEITLF